MNKVIYYSAIFLLLLSCNNGVKENNCVREAPLGDVTICFPKIEGQTECYTDPKIKELLSRFNDPSNTILGYYIDTEDYKKLDEITSIPDNNYYKIYIPYMSNNRKMTAVEMNQIMQMMTSGFIDRSLEGASSSSVFFDKDFEITQPLILEKYVLDPESSTTILLMGHPTNSEETAIAVSMSAILVQGKIIFISHYLDFKDESSISTLKNNTTQFISTFLEAN